MVLMAKNKGGGSFGDSINYCKHLRAAFGAALEPNSGITRAISVGVS